MNAARLLILAVGLVASVAVFLLMRYPNLRRAQFQQYQRFSVRASASCALAMLAVFVLMAKLQ